MDSVAAGPDGWLPVASGISNGAAAAGSPSQPFDLLPLQANAVFQQLAITLVAPSGSGSAVTTSSTFTLTALNSVVPAPTEPICQQQGWP